MAKFTHYNLILESIKILPSKRTQDMLKRRFGLLDGQRQTLEAIGQKYQITRERVRQIEEAALSVLRGEAFNSLKPVFQIVDDFFVQRGRVAREEKLLDDLTKTKHPHPYRGAVFFTLTLGQPYQRFVGSDQFHPLWTNSQRAYQRAQYLINALIKDLGQRKEVVSADYIFNFFKREAPDLSKQAWLAYLDISKRINQNNFGQFGLTDWPEINPRGVKDKAYIIFKKENRPLHFTQVAELINQANFGASLAHPQTVHNELIKDSRFVLVGRGTYALTEWGYQAGTIRQLITQLLKEQGPLTKQEILDQILKNRLVKENTVLINLQNRQYFVRDGEGRYHPRG